MRTTTLPPLPRTARSWRSPAWPWPPSSRRSPPSTSRSPRSPADTHASQTQLSWVIDAYALVFAALLLLGGAIGDRYGRRRALLAGLGHVRRRVAGRHDGHRPRLADRHARPCWVSAPRSSCRPRCPRSPAPSRASSETGRSAPGRASPAPAPSSACSPRVPCSRHGPGEPVFALNVALAVAAIVGTLRVDPGVRRPRAHRARPGRGADHRRRPRRPRLLDHRGADRPAGPAPAPSPASPPASSCSARSSSGSCATRHRCSTRGCSGTARSPPAPCRSRCSSSPSSASSSWSCSTCSSSAARARWCRRSAWSRWPSR